MIWVKYWPWWRQLGVWLQQTGFYLVCQKVTVRPVASSTPTKCEISCTEQLVHYNEEIISLWQIVTLWHTCFFNVETYSEKEDLLAFPLHCYHSWHFTINTRWVHGSATTRAVSSWKSRTPKQWCLRRGKKPHKQSTESCISECSMTCNVFITYGSFFLNLQPLEWQFPLVLWILAFFGRCF